MRGERAAEITAVPAAVATKYPTVVEMTETAIPTIQPVKKFSTVRLRPAGRREDVGLDSDPVF